MNAPSLRCPSAGLFYVFCDEKPIREKGSLAIGTVMVPQQRWSDLSPEQQQLRVPKDRERIERLKDVLQILDGVGLISWAKIDDMERSGHRDSASDVTGMARSNNIWGVAMATGAYRCIIHARELGLEVRTADLYYDTYSLRDDHRAALHNALRERVPKDIRKARADGHAPLDFRPRIRRVLDTPKADTIATSTKYQAGVRMADELLQHALDLRSVSSNGRIAVVDSSGLVRNFIRRFR
jgi:hypothetical protein